MVMRTPIVTERTRNGQRVDSRRPKQPKHVPTLEPAVIEWESERYESGIDLGDVRYL